LGSAELCSAALLPDALLLAALLPAVLLPAVLLPADGWAAAHWPVVGSAADVCGARCRAVEFGCRSQDGGCADGRSAGIWSVTGWAAGRTGGI
jgi:hypothetical protein